ncbi:MAG TPA: ribosomal protein S18-alanine N-acetyltransferase [Oligoflexia bacterium]|nr:ribosomal protein S18-alanine N-acetyltransferase [Oligoflexia bacterium]HMP47679.1 ribosomal protein S18-alanine N-acetyltransferase [Oligoflexia bacterium]
MPQTKERIDSEQNLEGLVCRSITPDLVDYIYNLEQRVYPNGWSRALIESEFDKVISLRLGLFNRYQLLLGYSFSYLIEDELHLLNIALDPEYQGQGLGTYLLSEIISKASVMGARVSYLEVRRSNQRAISLYRKFGYVETAYRKAYYQDNHEDAILMEADIGRASII